MFPNLGTWAGRRARMNPQGIALVQGDHRVSYAELDQRVNALAVALERAGVGPGDRVAYLGPNDIATFETFFATARLGAVFVALNTRLAAPEIAYMVADCEPGVLVLAQELAELGRTALGLVESEPHVILFGPDPDEGEYERAVARCWGSQRPATAVSGDDPVLILYTSGTTGRPKGAVLTHGNLTWNTLNQFAHFSLRSDTVALCSAPLFHVLGLGQITLPTLYAGGTVVVVPSFDPGGFLALIERERATAFPLAPTMMQMMCDHPAWSSTDLSSVEHVVYGGSPILHRVATAWLDRGVAVLQGYGMTEAAPGVLMALTPGAEARPLSAGVPHFFTDVALLQPDGSILDHGPGQGELLVRGPNVFAGYWNHTEATAGAFVDGWFRSGDIVRIDVDGWAYVVDRVKDMIISGGENIYPAEVEAALAEVDGVSDCTVVGIPDPRWGEVGVAYLTVRPGARLEVTAMVEHLHERLAKYKIPKHFHIVDDLPRTASGKVQRSRLRDQAAQDHVTPTDPV